MMQSKAPEKRFDKNLSFDCPRDAAWRRADCNSSIGRECSVPKPEHIGWPQDHRMAAHQSRRALPSCQMSLPQRNPQVRHQSLARLNAWLHRRSCLDGGGPVPLAARSRRARHRDHISTIASFFFFLPYARRQQDYLGPTIGVRLSYIGSLFARRTGSFWRPIPHA
ncbi:hypothetical protein V8C43DRAFT_168449 [Trichoderma afarasin]